MAVSQGASTRETESGTLSAYFFGNIHDSRACFNVEATFVVLKLPAKKRNILILDNSL